MPEEKRPLKVFICHAHSDKNAVKALYAHLTADGVDAWLDKEKLLPGQDWELEIRKAVREADVVVVCLSKQFNQAGFRQKEVRLALDTAMEKPEGEIFIIPARLEECDTLESLRKWHWVDLFEDDGYEMLLRALRARADKVGVTLQIKKKRAPKKSNQEKRIFYDLTSHYECDFENTTPETLANFLFETLTRIMRTVPSVDKSDNSRTAEYQTSQVEYLDPKDGKTNQHALIVHGKKVRYVGKGDNQDVEPLAIVSEMLIITVTQGVNRSRLRFDSNELPSDTFKNLVEWILADIGRDVSVELKNTPPRKIPTSTNVINDGYPQIHWDATDALQSGKPYISINITSKENRLIKCRCYIKSLELDGILRDDIKHELVKHTNRVSWSGGSDEEVGIKHIDPMGFGKINLASLDSKDFIRHPLQFEMAKGAQSKDKNGQFLPFGDYVVDLGLVCNADGADLLEIPIKIGFEYIEEHDYFEDNGITNGRETRKVLRLLKIEPTISASGSKTPIGLVSPVKSNAFEKNNINSNSVIRVGEIAKEESKLGSELPKAELQEKASDVSRQSKSLKPQKEHRKLKTEYVVAIIGAVATIIAGLLGSPFIEKWFSPVPVVTEIPTLSLTLTSQSIVPSQTIEATQPNKTPTITITPTKIFTATPTVELNIGSTVISENDGMKLLYVPAGTFPMGADTTITGFYNNNINLGVSPIHNVYLDSFWIDQTEVTNSMYSMCVKAGACKDTGSPRLTNPSYANHPVTWVSWSKAETYCEWAGRRLPTEAEWEKAARGTDGRTHPWGNAHQPPCSYMNRGDCLGDTALVGSYPIGASPYGALDMVGNVSEWVSDWYSASYYSISPRDNPPGPTNGEYKVLRGYSYADTYNVDYGNAFGRLFAKEIDDRNSWGFRCAMDAKP